MLITWWLIKSKLLFTKCHHFIGNIFLLDLQYPCIISPFNNTHVKTLSGCNVLLKSKKQQSQQGCLLRTPESRKGAQNPNWVWGQNLLYVNAWTSETPLFNNSLNPQVFGGMKRHPSGYLRGPGAGLKGISIVIVLDFYGIHVPASARQC